MKEWKCENCDKELKLEEELASYYNKHEKCLECNNKIFFAGVNQTALGKWKINVNIKENIENKENVGVDFQCRNCNKEFTVEKTMYNSVYVGQICWSCRTGKQ